MKKIFSQPKVVAHAISLFLLLTLAALYFFVQVPARSRYFSQRNFRVLAQTCEQIKKTLEALPESMRIAAKGVEANAFPSFTRGASEARVRELIDLIPALELIPNRPPTVEKIKPATNSINIRIRPGVGTSWVEFEYRGSAGTNTNLTVTINARADLGRLAAPPPREFDGLLITEETGEVMFERMPAGISIQKLKVEQMLPVSGSNLVQHATSVANASFAEGSYKFFMQPLRLDESLPSSGTNRWLVCGIVRADRFQSESREIDYIYLITFMFLVFFCALSVGFPKVAFADPRASLRRRDVMLLVIGTLGGAALLTILALDYGFYGTAEEHLDEKHLKPLAEKIRTNLTAEVHGLHDVVQGLNKLKNEDRYQASNSVTHVRLNTKVFTHIADPQIQFDTVSWLNSNGIQRAKWTVRPIITPLVDVSSRNYFRDAFKERTTTYTWRRGTNQFWLESIYNRATGENSAVLSFLSASGVVAIESRLQSVIRPVLPTGYGFCIVTSDGRVLFHSDERRNLRENLFEECDKPSLLRSAVLSRANHSELEGRYLGRTHHFFVTPIDNSPWTLVVFRDEQILSAANFEIVIASLALLALYFLIPAFPIIVPMARWLLSVAIGEFRPLPALPSWLWPDPARTSIYRWLAAVNFVLAVALIVVISSLMLSPTTIAWLAFGGSVAGLSVAAATLAYNASASKLLKLLPPVCSLSPKWSYFAALTSLVIIVAAVPAFACFKIAADQRIKLFTKYGQFTYANALNHQADRLKIEKGNAPGFASLKPPKTLDSTNSPWNIYLGPEQKIVYAYNAPPVTEPNKSFAWLFDSVTPLHDPVSVETRGLVKDRAQDESWFWESDSAGNLKFHVNNHRGDASFYLSDPMLHSFSASGQWPWVPGMILLALIAFITLFPVCFVASRVFLIHLSSGDHIASPGTFAESGESKATLRMRWMSLTPPQRLALSQVARHGFIHAEHPELPGLIASGLLILKPRLMVTPTWKEMALRSAPKASEIYGKDFASESSWEVMKGPVYFGLVAVALLMFLTQPDIYQIVFGVIAGFAAGPPAILKLLSLFDGEKEKKAGGA